MKIGEYEQMMSYLTRPGFKDGSPLVPEPKPLTAEEFKSKADLYIKGALGGFPKDEMITKLQEQLNKVQESGTMSKEEAINFINERTQQLREFIKENPGETLPGLDRENFSDGTPSIKEILKNMAEDRTYTPPINLSAKGRGLPAGFRQAKKELREEIPNFDELYNRNLTYRKKQKLKQKLKDDPEFRQTEMAKKAERRRRRRVEKIKDKTSLTPDEKLLNYEQSLITRQLNDQIKANPDLILKNKKVMDELSTTVAPSGDIIKVKPNLSQLKQRGIFEIEHQRDIYKKGAMKDFPYNRNLIMAPHNRAGGFKDAAEKFIEKNPNSPKINNILAKAEELKITLQPNVPEGTFKTKGLGYKQVPNAVQKFVEVAKSKTPELVGDKIGIAASTKNIEKAKAALGLKKLKEIPGVTTADKIPTPDKTKTRDMFKDFEIRTNQLGSNLGLIKGVGETIKAIPTPTGTLALTAGLGVDPTSAIDRVALGAEAAFAPELVKQTSRLTSNPIVQRFFNLGLSPQMAMRAARIASPLGVASLAGEGVYQLYKAGQAERAKLEAMTPEERAGYLRAQEAENMIAAADGGLIRKGFADGPDDPSKRKFMKVMGGLTALPFVGKFFKIAEPVAPVVSKAAESVPPYFLNLVEKIRALGKSFPGPKERSESFKYKDYDMDIDYDTGAIDIKKTREAMIPGGDEAGIAEEVYMSYKPGMADESTKGLKPADEYEEFTARPDREGKMKDVEGGVPDEVIDEGSTSKEELEQLIIENIEKGE